MTTTIQATIESKPGRGAIAALLILMAGCTASAPPGGTEAEKATPTGAELFALVTEMDP